MWTRIQGGFKSGTFGIFKSLRSEKQNKTKHLLYYKIIRIYRPKSALGSAIDCQRCGRKRRDPTWLEIQAAYDLLDTRHEDVDRSRFQMESVADRRRHFEAAKRLQVSQTKCSASANNSLLMLRKQTTNWIVCLTSLRHSVVLRQRRHHVLKALRISITLMVGFLPILLFKVLNFL